MPPASFDLTPTIAAALRSPGDSARRWRAADVPALIETATRHRVLLLLGWLLRDAGQLDAWPASFVDAFERAERKTLLTDCLRQAELVSVLGEFRAAGVRPLLFKGSALAHVQYPAPHVRVRADTDVLVPHEDVDALERVLTRLGYTRPAETSGTLVSYQSHYQKTDRHGVTHAFDVHWKISNLQAFANGFRHDELWPLRVAIEPLGSSAFTVDARHALLLGLIHRAGHHPGSTNLLWMYDFHLLAGRLGERGLEEVREIAATRGLSEILDEGLALADAWFGNGDVDHAPLVIGQPWTRAEVLRLDLQALPDWRSRGRLLREHLLPASSYMRAKYGVRSNAWLPVLYVWRAFTGMPKWLRRPTVH